LRRYCHTVERNPSNTEISVVPFERRFQQETLTTFHQSVYSEKNQTGKRAVWDTYALTV
jgi:hypothetical protein